MVLGFDLETTGLSVSVDSPIQIALCSSTSKDEFRTIIRTYCNPYKPIAPGAKAVHGISEEQLVGYPDSAMASWLTIRTIELFGPCYLATYNGKAFDVPMLTREAGCDLPEAVKHIDVMEAAYRYLGVQENFKLPTLVERFVPSVVHAAHDAQSDVKVLISLLYAICDIAKLDVAELYESLLTPVIYEFMPISKYKGLPISEVPISFARWAIQQEGGVLSLPDMRATMNHIIGGA